ncbi:MAG: asparagine synthase-related protein [Persicimonas sp.]
MTVEKYRVDRQFYLHEEGEIYDSLADIPGRLTVDREVLPVFLRLGYVPGTKTLFEGVECLPGGHTVEYDKGGWRTVDRFGFSQRIDRDRYRGRSEDELSERGARLFVEAVDRCFEPSRRPIVPLSGGMDSRAIVAALLEMTEAKNIRTVTFGTPGTAEFDLANRVARRAGTDHLALDMRRMDWTTDRLVEIARHTDANTDLFQPVVWTWVDEHLGETGRIWSGFTGDGIGGSKFRSKDPPRREAASYFLANATNRITFYPTPEGWEEPYVDWLDYPTKYDAAMASTEAMWFEHHVERYASHHLFLDDWEFALPFMDDDFMSFMFSVDPSHRAGKSLFDRMMSRRFSRLFELPVTGEGYVGTRRPARNALHGAKLAVKKAMWRIPTLGVPHPDVSYIDYRNAIRHDDDFHDFVDAQLQDLKARQLLDESRIDEIWRARYGRRAEPIAMMLTLIASLEIALKAFCD